MCEIDEVKIYNYLRTPAQIAWDYNRGAPVAQYDFDECTGAALHDTAPKSDRSSTTYNGTIYPGSGTPPENTATGSCSSGNNYEMWNDGTNGKYSASLGFDGFDDYVSSSLVTDAIDNFSVSMWVKWSGSSGMQTLLFNGNNDSCNGWGIELDSSNNYEIQLLNHCMNTGETGQSLTPGTWQHLTVVRRNTVWEAYLNGRQITVTGGGTYNANTPTVQTIIGAMDTDGVQHFNGQIDEVKIWNYPLTSAQIKTLYNNSSAVQFSQ